MDNLDHTRQAFINSLTRILNAWNSAINDANSRGYPPGNNPTRNISENTSVEAAAFTRSQAKEWLQQLETVVADILLLANRAALLWPPTPAVFNPPERPSTSQRSAACDFRSIETPNLWS